MKCRSPGLSETELCVSVWNYTGCPKKMGLAIIAISPKPFNLGQ